MGRPFETLCLQHALQISRMVGFSAVDFTMGPCFGPARRSTAGVQVDLVFDRADDVLPSAIIEARDFLKSID
jgi:hypothetical protein